MEKAMDWEQFPLINELTQGKELAKQLKNHLNPSSSQETRQSLVEKILRSYEKALSLLNRSAFMVENKPTINSLESPTPPSSFANSSPRSEGSDQESKDQCHKDLYKKRKTMPRWTEQVRVCTGSGLEGPLDDGYCWRKYGQKDILGANYPRGYYRCTHRHAQGCLATKQVQRSDEDPTIFEVTYRGRHTCVQASNLAMAAASIINEGSKENKDHYQQQQQRHEEKLKQSQDLILNFGAGLKVKTEDLGTREDIFPSFTFPYTATESDDVENNIFSEAMMENRFMGNFSPTFISPATSESNYFSVSPCHMNSFGLGHNVQTSESDHTEIISAPTSGTNSPIGDLDISLVKVNFDTNFPFDIPEFFS